MINKTEKTSKQTLVITSIGNKNDEFEKGKKEMEDLLLDVSLQLKGVEEMIEEMEKEIKDIEGQIEKLDVLLKEFEENSYPRLKAFNS
ncbi:MAG: hypothetical protein U9Q88_05325 [Bacillota bacterium]|nr:hypothetical protein [Bacillota bacterium]